MSKQYEILSNHVYVTKLAGFEYSDYIQYNKTSQKLHDEDLPLIQGINVRDGHFSNVYKWYINKDISDKLERSKLNKQCILIPYVGSNIGDLCVFYHKEDCHLASNVAKLELIDNYFDIEFLYYYLKSPIGQSFLLQRKQGSSQPNITMEAIRNTQVRNFSFNKQIKIKNILKNIDDIILNDNKLIYCMSNMVSHIFSYYFLKFDFPNKNGNPYKSSGGTMIYNEELKMDIPEGWRVCPFDDIIEKINGYPFSSEKYCNVGKYKIYTIKNVQDGYIVPTTDNCINEIPNNMNMECALGLGDIILSLTGNVGRSGLVFENDVLLNQRVLKIVPKDIPKSYLYALVQNENFKKYAERLASGTSQKNLSPIQLGQIPVVLPPKDLLALFSEQTEHIIDAIVNLYKKNEELKSLRDFLLPLLMNGQVVIRD